MTQGERLARIEALLEGVNERLGKIETRLTTAEAAQVADVAELAKLQNRGAGLLAGVALFAGVIGAKFDKLWQFFVSG